MALLTLENYTGDTVIASGKTSLECKSQLAFDRGDKSI